MRNGLLVVLLLVLPGAAAVAGKLRQYPQRFAEVDAAGLYRGGFPTAAHIHSLHRDKNIRTVVSLTSEEDDRRDRDELRALADDGLRFFRFPMPGNGCAELPLLDRAADVVGNRIYWPLFFHCSAGKQRSNALLAVHRMKNCGWTLEQALDELEELYDLDRRTEKALVDRLTEYHQYLTEQRQGRGPARPQ